MNQKGPDSPSPHESDIKITSLFSLALIATLALSMVITMLTSSTLSSLKGPDERHHYSYVKHVAEHPFSFPPRFEDIRTPTTTVPPRSANAFTNLSDQNQLRHPPLYYYLMAIPYKILSPSDHVPSIADNLENHGGVSMRWSVPALRITSLIFPLLSSVGIFLLLHYMVATSLLSKWAALIFALCNSFLPAYTFIGATLNNDALSLAIWPFLLLFVIRFLRNKRWRDAYIAILLCAVGVLTKVTLYPLILSAATALLVATVRSLREKGKEGGSFSRFVKEVWPHTRGEGAWFIAALAGVILSLLYALITAIRYGSIYPEPESLSSGPGTVESSLSVGGLRLLKGQDLSVALNIIGAVEENLESGIRFAFWWLSMTVRSLFGVASHSDKIFPPNPERLAQVLLIITLLAVALIGYRLFWASAESNRFDVYLSLWLIGTAVLYVAFAAYLQYEPYHSTGHASAQGRYLIGYIDWWLLGVLVVLSKLWINPTRGPAKLTLKVLAIIPIIVALGGMFVQPFLFLRQSFEGYRGLNVGSLVADEAEYQGLESVDLNAVKPAEFVEKGIRPNAVPPEGSFVLAWDNSEVRGSIVKESRECLEVWVHAWGESAWGELPALRLRAEPQLGGSESPSEVLRFDRQPGVETARLEVGRSLKEEVLVSLEFINNDVESPPFVRRVWPRSRVVRLIAVYAGGVEC